MHSKRHLDLQFKKIKNKKAKYTDKDCIMSRELEGIESSHRHFSSSPINHLLVCFFLSCFRAPSPRLSLTFEESSYYL